MLQRARRAPPGREHAGARGVCGRRGVRDVRDVRDVQCLGCVARGVRCRFRRRADEAERGRGAGPLVDLGGVERQ
ncbi:hypothetical protein VM98_18890 [Streptomyces rubellomurinus subsp. indigoferus]|nr:hypothetical protein VM98_18890 [Streptomyces rubellomurinus subsp. indigoferus]